MMPTLVAILSTYYRRILGSSCNLVTLSLALVNQLITSILFPFVL